MNLQMLSGREWMDGLRGWKVRSPDAALRAKDLGPAQHSAVDARAGKSLFAAQLPIGDKGESCV